MTTARHRSASDDSIRREVRHWALARNLGFCSWGCGEKATNGCHRLPEGQGGPYIPANIIGGCGSGTTGCHAATESQRDLSYRCGWLIRSSGTSAGRTEMIVSTPALVCCQGIPGWWILDDGYGLARMAEPDEVPAWMYRGSFEDAVIELFGSRGAVA